MRVVQEGSFRGAARALGMPKTTVSQKVAKLEEQLGVQACGTGLVSDDVVVLRRAAERGFGIARLTVIVCEAILEGGFGVHPRG